MRDPDDRWTARCDGVDRGQPPGGDGRPRRRPRRHRRLRLPQRPRHGACSCARSPPAASPARSCWPRAWSSTARAATAAPSTGSCGPARGAARTSTPAASSRRARTAAATSQPEAVPEDAPLDPRNVYAATKLAQEHLCNAFARETGATVAALRYHNVYGPRMPRDTPYAGVASIFRSSLAAGRAAARVRGRRAAERLRPRARRRPSQPAGARTPGRPARSTSPAARRAAWGRWPPRSRAPSIPTLEPVVTGRVARRRRPPRLRLARARRDRARIHAPSRTSTRACASSRRRSFVPRIRRRRPRRVDRVRALHARPRAGRDHRRDGVVLRGRRQRRGRRGPAGQALRRRRLLHRRSARTSAVAARRSG